MENFCTPARSESSVGLRTMEGYGLVALTKNARQTRPPALATEFLVVLD